MPDRKEIKTWEDAVAWWKGRKIKNDHILTAAAYFHAKFENIHPFTDGNGRAGRLAMNYFMAIHDYPVIIFHEEDRKDYFAALIAKAYSKKSGNS